MRAIIPASMSSVGMLAYAAALVALWPLAGASARSSTQGAGSARASLAERLDRYVSGGEADWSVYANDQQQLIADFRRNALPWVRARGEDDPKRRLAVATYALDLLKDITTTNQWQGPGVAAQLLEWTSAFLRQRPPLPAERAWHQAALGLLERSAPPATLARHLADARQRFPEDDRWVLVGAIVEEFRTPLDRNADGTFSASSAVVTRVRAAFDSAAARPSVAQEAQVRLGYFEMSLGNTADALARFDKAGTPTDPSVRYWQHLFRGRALERSHRGGEAIDAYRQAVAAAPSGQSAAFQLAMALVGERQLQEASRVAARTIAPASSAPGDPWSLYFKPDLRFWPSSMAALRREFAP
jgi:tetratricopeptide (TPR) repeat protein